MAQAIIFSRFERLWHWTQATLIVGMMVTGFEVHGQYLLLGFEAAADWHRVFAWALIGLWIFAAFWHITTGEWRQYIPTVDRLRPDGLARRVSVVPSLPLKRVMAGGTELTLHRPIVPGDRLTGTRTLIDIYEKKGRSGPLIFSVYELVVVDADGVPVLVERQTAIAR